MPAHILDTIADTLLVTAITGTTLVLLSLAFRAIINRIAFPGMKKAERKAFLQSKTLRERLFITYIRKLDPDEIAEPDLVRWFLTGFNISALTLLMAEILIWLDNLLFWINGQRVDIDFYVRYFHVNWESIDDFLGVVTLSTLPICILLALPNLLRIRAERGDKI